MSATTSNACGIASGAGGGGSFDAVIGELQRSQRRSDGNAQFVGSGSATERAAGVDSNAGV